MELLSFSSRPLIGSIPTLASPPDAQEFLDAIQEDYWSEATVFLAAAASFVLIFWLIKGLMKAS